MPVSFLSNEQRESYGHYTGAPSPHDLARYFHLDDVDHALIAKKRGDHNRLGFAVQLGTVRYLGTFLDDPMAVPPLVLYTLAKQLRIETMDATPAYSTSEQRWQHATEIRVSYGYVEITEQQVAFRLTRWLYALCWTGTDRPSVLFERATTRLATHKVLLPGCSTPECYVARLRSRVEERLWRSLVHSIDSEQQARLKNLPAAPVGNRSSQLDRLRAGPVTISGPSLVKACCGCAQYANWVLNCRRQRASLPPVWQVCRGLQVPPRLARCFACQTSDVWPRWLPLRIAWKPLPRTTRWKCWNHSSAICSATL